MILLIDAYNLLKTVLQVQYISDGQRQQFLRFFARYAKLRPGHELILVFDGGPDLYLSHDRYQQVAIMYAGSLQTADDVLKKKVYEYCKYDTLLITCDRQIRQFAAQHQVESLGSQEFYYILQDILASEDTQEKIVAQTICKTTQESNADLDALMEAGSRNLMTKDQDKVIKKGVQTLFDVEKYAGKKDKKLLKKIMKL